MIQAHEAQAFLAAAAWLSIASGFLLLGVMQSWTRGASLGAAHLRWVWALRFFLAMLSVSLVMHGAHLIVSRHLLWQATVLRDVSMFAALVCVIRLRVYYARLIERISEGEAE